MVRRSASRARRRSGPRVWAQVARGGAVGPAACRTKPCMGRRRGWPLLARSAWTWSMAARGGTGWVSRVTRVWRAGTDREPGRGVPWLSGVAGAGGDAGVLPRRAVGGGSALRGAGWGQAGAGLGGVRAAGWHVVCAARGPAAVVVGGGPAVGCYGPVRPNGWPDPVPRLTATQLVSDGHDTPVRL